MKEKLWYARGRDFKASTALFLIWYWGGGFMPVLMSRLVRFQRLANNLWSILLEVVTTFTFSWWWNFGLKNIQWMWTKSLRSCAVMERGELPASWSGSNRELRGVDHVCRFHYSCNRSSGPTAVGTPVLIESLSPPRGQARILETKDAGLPCIHLEPG